MYRKIISLFLSIAVLFLAGCTPQTEEAANQTTSNTEIKTEVTAGKTDLTKVENVDDVDETTTQKSETTTKTGVKETTESKTEKENNSTVSQTEKKEDSTQAKVFNMKKYVGEWGAEYLCDGIYDYTLNIKSVSNNKITFDLEFYRIVGFDNQTISVDKNGVAQFDISSGSYRLVGTMKFLNSKIEMRFSELSHEWYRLKTFVFEKLGGASPYNIFNYIGKDLQDVVKSFGGGITDYYAGGKFINCESVGVSFFYYDYDTGRYSESECEKVFTIMAYGKYDYGYGLTCGKTYPEMKKILARYVALEEPEEFYSEEDGMYIYHVGPFYIDGQQISIDWYDDPYTTGANLIIFNGKI